MKDAETGEPARKTFRVIPRIRRVYSGGAPKRSPLVNVFIMIGVVAIISFLVYELMFDAPSRLSSEVVDLRQSTELIRELSTVKSHLRFGVIVREESGNIIVRRLTDQAEYIGMDDLQTILFQNPTALVELHGVATYGVRLEDLTAEGAVRQNDSAVMVPTPKAEILDVKLIAADTRVLARMKGLFRSSSDMLLLEANRQGEAFVRHYAESDSTLLNLAAQRAQDVISTLVQAEGKKTVFVQ